MANYRDAEDLALGLRYVLAEADYETLRQHCLQKVGQCYSQQRVAELYTELYDQML